MVIYYAKDKYVKSDKTQNVSVIVRIGRSYLRKIKTGLSLLPDEWDDVKQAPKSKQNRMVIEAVVERLKAWERQQHMAGLRVTPESFEKFNSVVSADDFIAFYRMALAADKGLVSASYRDQMQTLNLIAEYCPQASINDITRRFVDGFNTFLIQRKYGQNTLKKHHKNLKKYINRAIDYGLMKIELHQHPYRGFKLSAKPSDRTNLSMSQLEAIAALELSGSAAMVRDVFLFCAATGSRFIDSQQAGYLIEDGEISWVPVKTQKHTGRVRVPVDLICRDWVRLPVPVMSNAFGNRVLKTIAIDAGIDKPISFHTARHTFLTLVAKKTGNLFKVMKYAGLRKPDTAMVYIHLAGV